LFTRYYTLIVGIAFVMAGVGGFLPLTTQPPSSDAPALALNTSYGYLLGLFPINFVHNLIHLTLGVTGLLAFWQYLNPTSYCRWLAVILGVFTLLGLIPALNTLGGILPLFGHDVWLHGVEAFIAAYLGWFAPAKLRAVTPMPSYEGLSHD
jgi:hypothetical protein